MPTGEGVLLRARQHIGEAYVNQLVPKNNPNWRGPWDCAEFASWLVYQEGGILYGCLDNTTRPALAEAYTGAWQRDSSRLGIRIPIEQAIGTVGAFLLRYPPAPGRMGHIAVSDGAGGTVEARGRAYGVVAYTAQGRGWDTGVVLSGFSYDAAIGANYSRPRFLYFDGAPNMRRDVVMEIQRALAAAGCDPGPIDGLFGPNTTAAVAAFQNLNGFVIDGQVGEETASKLGIRFE